MTADKATTDGLSGAAPLAGVKVVDAATLFAGPVVATILGDFGADVIKIEHPRGDALRGLGWEKDGVSLWWSIMGRNKQCVTLNLSKPEGQELLKRLLADADVFVESFRPDTLERWGLGPEVLHEVNPALVIVRTTGFGQTGPYRSRPGFGTLAEAMSGFAHINGWPDGPPTLPPFALGDSVAALTGTIGTLMALWWREHGGAGRGQVVDVSILESLFWILGPQATVYDQLGIVQGRTGNAAPFTAPRNAFRAKDGRWLGLSGSTNSIAERVMRIVGRSDLIDEPWFANHEGRLQHADELDTSIQAWIGVRTSAEVIEAFADQEGAIAPVYSIADVFEDPQFAARETIVSVDHPRLGPIRMQSVNPRLDASPGAIRFVGAEIGAHNDEVLGQQLGLSAQRMDELAELGVISRPAETTTSVAAAEQDDS